jgi:hypothetical protein
LGIAAAGLAVSGPQPDRAAPQGWIEGYVYRRKPETPQHFRQLMAEASSAVRVDRHGRKHANRALGKQGRPKKGEEKHGQLRFNTAEHWKLRLKRDHPEILEQLARA